MRYVLTQRGRIDRPVGECGVFNIPGVQREHLISTNGNEIVIAISEVAEGEYPPSIPGFDNQVQWVPFPFYIEQARSLGVFLTSKTHILVDGERDENIQNSARTCSSLAGELST